MSWLRLGIDVAMFTFAAGAWRRRGRRPSANGVLAFMLPTIALVSLFVLAGLSSPHAHRASHAGVTLADAGCLAAAAVSWAGVHRARRLASKYRVPLVIYGLAIGLFFLGEAIAVTVLNW
jgi:hypothetical protein